MRASLVSTCVVFLAACGQMPNAADFEDPSAVCTKPGFPAGCATCLDGYLLINTNDGNVCAPDQPIWGARPVSPGDLFSDNGDETISDSQTQLMWQKADNPTWPAEPCKSLRLAGHKDWRLPTVAELRTLVDFAEEAPAVPAVWKATTSVTNYLTAVSVSSGLGISSTWNESRVWSVEFGYGTMRTDADTNARIRCVR